MDNLLLGGNKSLTLRSYAKALTPYALWDASDATSITLNGGNVSQLNDLSGNSRHWVQATAANQPPYNTNPINGKAVLTPDGVSDIMTCATFHPTGAMTLFAVYRVRALPNVAHAFFGWLDSSRGGLFDHIVLSPTYPPYVFCFDYVAAQAPTGLPGGDTAVGFNAQVVSVAYDNADAVAASSYTMMRNSAGVTEVLGGGGDTFVGWATTGTLFGRPNNLYFLNCDFAFMAVYSGVLTAPQLALLTALATAEYAIT